MQAQPAPEEVHPLVEAVRVLPAVQKPIVDNSRRSNAWAEIVESAGIDAAAERCLKCHFTEETEEDPHPGKHLDHHASATFGCVLCHGGNGNAEVKKKAHASAEGFPFLTGQQVEAACGKCHLEPAVLDAPNLSGGRYVLNKYGCVTCHHLPVQIPVRRYAPRLDFIGNKVTRAWLDQWLSDPTEYLPKSKMPRVEMAELERAAIVEFLSSLRLDEQLQPIEGSGDAEAGQRLYVESECHSCHATPEIGHAVGPDLTKVDTKVNRTWLWYYLKNPANLHPETKMPSYDFTDQQALNLTEYLLGNVAPESTGDAPVAALEGGNLSEVEPPAEIDAERAADGFSLYISKGCAQCHGIGKYMGVDISNQLLNSEIRDSLLKIQSHHGASVEVPEIDMPESDVRLMTVAILALRRSEIYRALSYKLKNGALGDPNRFVHEFWELPIPAQEKAPDYYNEAVSQLTPEACGACHQQQFSDWKTSRHAIAMGPGVHGQLIEQKPGTVLTCQKCHAPLSEQLEFLTLTGKRNSDQVEFSSGGTEFISNEGYDENLQSHGIVCAACHVRSHQRFGPPFSEHAAAANVFAEGHHGGAITASAYNDSSFCKPCHQFEENGFALNGKLLENTYNEWLESPHAKEGKTCQSCHMPDSRHQWRGIHNPDSVRDALDLDVEIKNYQESLEAEIRLTNHGAGHHLPTYLTPAIFVTTRLLDSTETQIPKTETIRVIQRRVPLSLDKEVFDTRIPAGGTWVYTYKSPHANSAKFLEIQLEVHPDHFYNDFFEVYKSKTPEGKLAIKQALEITEQSPYFLMSKQIPLVSK
ncbi:MAG: c-type cytochrome [Candidatus Poribacteria bacterium]|nr:c-type cytochrome [Candidatus Poribacteria bacterium]